MYNCILNLFTRSAAKAAEGRAGSGGQRGNPDLTLLTASASNLPFLHSRAVFFLLRLYLSLLSSDCEVHGPLLRKADQERRMSLQSRGAPIKVDAHQMANICNIYMHKMRLRFSHPH